MPIKVFCEDAYGREFFKRLVNWLKDEKKVPRALQMTVDRLAGLCNTKSERQIRAAASISDRIIVVVDAHGRQAEKVEREVLEHVPNRLRKNVQTIVLDYEIEEWVCVSRHLRFGNKPSDTLKHQIDYEKYKLPSLVSELNFDILMNYKSFAEFVKCLRRRKPVAYRDAP